MYSQYRYSPEARFCSDFSVQRKYGKHLVQIFSEQVIGRPIRLYNMKYTTWLLCIFGDFSGVCMYMLKHVVLKRENITQSLARRNEALLFLYRRDSKVKPSPEGRVCAKSPS